MDSVKSLGEMLAFPTNLFISLFDGVTLFVWFQPCKVEIVRSLFEFAGSAMNGCLEDARIEVKVLP